MQSSGRNSPCPCCGRVRTNHCRFDLDGANPIVLCHVGVASGPPTNMRIGDTTDFAGRTWALIKTNAGHSGNSHEFRPHRELTRSELRQHRRQRATQQINDLHRLDQALADLDTLVNDALKIPPLEQMSDIDIKTARDTAEHAYETSKALLARVGRSKRIDVTLTPVWEQLKTINRDLKYQLADLNRYCANPGKYWQDFLLDKPSELPPEPSPTNGSDWFYWNAHDPNYKPTDPLVTALYEHHCQQRGWSA